MPMSTDGYPSGRMFRTDVSDGCFGRMFRTDVSDGYLYDYLSSKYVNFSIFGRILKKLRPISVRNIRPDGYPSVDIGKLAS